MTGREPARVQILQVPDCPLVGRLTAMLQDCMLAAGVQVPVEVRRVDFPSPTLVIDGLDVATGHPVRGDPRCRLDLPTREQILAALRRIG
jgi:hypothetical protein